jgi:serine/threonine protein phosphatase PrpC
MLICPACGYPNPIENAYCQECGADLQTNQQLVVYEPTISDSKVVTLASDPSPEYRIVRVDWAAATDQGRQRQRNEDDFYACYQSRSVQTKNSNLTRVCRGLFVVCDGMGGHAGGEIASAMAVSGIAEQFSSFWGETLPDSDRLIAMIRTVNQTIFLQNEQNARQDYGRMGTTLVLLALHNTDITLAHVGDSRIYRICDTPKPFYEQLTRDHEVGNRLIDQGVPPEVAWARFDAHQLTQAIGPNENSRVDPAVQSFKLTENTLFLLCTDGLCDNGVIDNHWKTHLLPLLSPAYDLQQGVEDVIALGNEMNGHDNLTAILVRCLVENTTPNC